MTLGTVCDIFTRFRYSTEDGANDIILSGIPDGRTKEQRTLLEAHGMARRHQAPTANDAFDPALWETFVSTTLGLEVPTLAALPRLHNSPLAKCGCKKFCIQHHACTL